MISFEEHQKNADHFYSIGQKILEKLDAAGLLKSSAWNGERYCGYAAASRGFRLDSIELTNKFPATAELEAHYWCGDSTESSTTEIPVSMLDTTMLDTMLDLFITEKTAERDKILSENAEKQKAAQRVRDEADLVRLQAKLLAG